jgi:drug/metabolite transporter (DMT)-like permease
VDVLLALLAAVFFGAYSVTIRVGQRRVPDVQAGAGATVAIAVCIALGASVVGAPQLPDVSELWPFVVLGAAVPGISTFLFQRAVQEAGASRPTVVLGTSPLLSVLIATIVLDETLDAAILAGTIFIVFGTVTLARERARPAHVRLLGLVLAGVCAVLFAMRDNVVRATLRDIDVPALHAGAASLVGAAVAVGLYLALRRDRPRGAARAALRPMLPAGVALGCAYLSLIAAYDAGPVTTVAPLAGTQPLWAVLMAAVVLGRSEAVGVRLVVAAVLVVLGGGLIGLSR